MKPGYEEQEHLHNPDTLVKWDSVCQMVVPTNKAITCPICLSPPVAARVTKCGHIFCWPCLQHYIALSEHSWRKCPICFESIYTGALKRVRIVDTQLYQSATPSKPLMMEFTLMKRTASSTVALPVASHRKWNTSLPLVDLPNALTFSKLLIASQEYMNDLIQQEKAELLELSKTTTEGDYEQSFIEMCLAIIESEEQPAPYHPKPKISKESSSDTYHFYQTSDGQYFYLHPLDIKILKHEFGSYDAMPVILKLPVISIRESTVNQDLRKRCKYLAHLPLSCDISFCEVDLTEVVSESTFSHFQSELTERTTKLVQLEAQRRKELHRASRKPLFENDYAMNYEVRDELPTQAFGFSLDDFGPPLSSSPDVQSGLDSVASTPPNKSFANIASTSSALGPSPWRRIEAVQDDKVWSLDISKEMIESAVQTPEGTKGKKKAKKVVLLGNSGGRGRS